ncbi:hypothetical protein M434DRAFT_13018 [Hypoxylon sp. CO27-5]|nr:hypothetical protein M434DRAFT_13018 [Hypoxylon sp. CO27-5]
MSTQRTYDQDSSYRRRAPGTHRCDDPQICRYCKHRTADKEKRANGMCSRRSCPNPTKSGKSKCEHHLKEQAQSAHARYHRRQEEKHCTRCPNKLARGSKTHCEVHREVHREQNRARQMHKMEKETAKAKEEVPRRAKQIVDNTTHGPRDTSQYGSSNSSHVGPSSGSTQQQNYSYDPPQNQYKDDIVWSNYIYDDAWE